MLFHQWNTMDYYFITIFHFYFFTTVFHTLFVRNTPCWHRHEKIQLITCGCYRLS